ncbi:MAG: energy-coupling factor ABC transporter ATP-binding protein [Bacillota bacterium]|jgi:energy-coupling factor transport system ATP-binding protein
MALIKVKNLSFSYNENGEDRILKNISFQLEQGSLTAVIGLSGCGKTTLCHCLCGIIPEAVGGKMQGDIFIGDLDVSGGRLCDLASTVGLVMQNPDDQLVCTTVEDEVAFALENLALPPAEIQKKTDEILNFLQIDNLRLQNPGRLSGGQKQLVAIASVLALSPRVLIFDEPMSHLDEKGRAMIRETLEKLKTAGKTILVVEHNLRLIDFADSWLILEEGRLAALDTPRRIKEDADLLSRLHLIF